MATSAPSRANRAATARPMPLSAPVISATLPFSRPEPGKKGSQSGFGFNSLSWPGSWSSWTISTVSVASATSSLLGGDPGALGAEGFEHLRPVLGLLFGGDSLGLTLVGGAEPFRIAASVLGIVGHLVVLVLGQLFAFVVMLAVRHSWS